MLREVSQEKLSELREIETEIEDLDDSRGTLKSQQRERNEVEQWLTRIDDEIKDSQKTLTHLQDRREDILEEVADLETDVEQLEDESHDEILALHKEANQLEYDIGKLESKREETDEEIADVERRIDRLDELEDERLTLEEEIKDLRTRIERLERQAVNEFNEHMETVLDLLGYDNLERIWLEPVEQEISEGRRKVVRDAFHLHVVRQTDSGTTYRDSVSHLSESEGKVTGLVFALAGYLVHDVSDAIPFMLLDSIEAVDSDRIAGLVEYMKEQSEYLVVALLQEDESSLDEEYRCITKF